MFEAIKYDLHGAVAVITLNRPERLNAINQALREELHIALEEAKADEGVRALVITGAGRGFCAGADLSGARGSGPPPETSQAEKLDEVQWIGRFALGLEAFDKPMICAVNGVAAGGGMGLALGADIRLGSEATRFKTAFAERALGPDCGVSYFLPRTIGYSRAADLLLTCRMVEAEEAYRLGLIDRLVPHERLMEETMTLAAAIAEGPPVALRVTKRVLQFGAGASLEEAVRREAWGLATVQKARNDMAESGAAFIERRKANFTGT